MKRIIALILCLNIFFITACNYENVKTNEDAFSNKFGMTREKLPDFEDDENKEQLPKVYEENGLFGYKNPDSSVYYPAVFIAAEEFKHGFANVVKSDGNDTYVGMYLNYETGELALSTDYSREFNLYKTNNYYKTGFEVIVKEYCYEGYDSCIKSID